MQSGAGETLTRQQCPYTSLMGPFSASIALVQAVLALVLAVAPAWVGEVCVLLASLGMTAGFWRGGWASEAWRKLAELPVAKKSSPSELLDMVSPAPNNQQLYYQGRFSGKVAPAGGFGICGWWCHPVLKVDPRE